MSRIHEAIRKVARERQSETGSPMATVEEVLSTSSMVAAGVGTPRDGHEADKIQILHCRREVWKPDQKRVLFSCEDSNAPAREQFRSMRTKLSRLHTERNLRAIAIGSALSGEGKTFVATNLAYALAAQGDNRVLLLDTDLRRGSVADMLGAPVTPGLSEHLLEGVPTQDVIQTGQYAHLYVLPSGSRVAEPGELIANVRFKKLIADCRSVFDWIVVDTPPVIQFSDASTIANLCDAVLIVVKGGATPVHMAKRALQVFSEHEVIGAVLNRAAMDASVAKYYNYY